MYNKNLLFLCFEDVSILQLRMITKTGALTTPLRSHVDKVNVVVIAAYLV